ncbi:MAG: phospholipase [Actinomycetota bacterium]|nr:phospholipase [Actinomycetota bacterium]
MDAVVREPDGEAQGALVLLHGRGADERDLAPLLDVLDPARRLVGLSPGAPLDLEGRPASRASRVPPGGRHWYVVARVGFPESATFRESLRALESTLDGWLAERGVPWERTVVGGFSQGAVMSLALGLDPGRPAPAGVLAMSGFLATVDGWEPDLAGRAGLPVLLTHGRADPVIEVGFGRQARERLDAAGLAVTYLETDVGHTIDPRILGDLEVWVAERVDGDRPGTR